MNSMGGNVERRMSKIKKEEDAMSKMGRKEEWRMNKRRRKGE